MMNGDELARALARDYRAADLDEADLAMLGYAVKLTRSPHSVSGEDVEELRGVGFDDTAVLDICQVTSYYNYVNRMAEGLGVELEESWTEDEMVMTREEFEEERRTP